MIADVFSFSAALAVNPSTHFHAENLGLVFMLLTNRLPDLLAGSAVDRLDVEGVGDSRVDVVFDFNVSLHPFIVLLCLLLMVLDRSLVGFLSERLRVRWRNGQGDGPAS